MSTLLTQTIDTPDGPFTVVADEDGAVRASGWTADAAELIARLPGVEPGDLTPGEVAAMEAVRAYYDGDVRAIDTVPVRVSGTALREEGWEALRRIEPGQPLTYSELAQALGRPSAVRAAASVCAQNHAALFIPCHRVLRKGGDLGGFAWGLDVKRSLLAREARSITWDEARPN